MNAKTDQKTDKTTLCVAAYDGGDKDSATVLSATVPLSDEEWVEVIDHASALFDPVEEGTEHEALTPELRVRLEAVLSGGGGAMDFLPILRPDLGVTVQRACRVEWT